MIPGDDTPVQPSVTREQLAEKCRETREKVISELYSTETDYCACLELCLNTFFASPSSRASALSADDMETLFGHVEDVVNLSQSLIGRLRDDAVGKPFDLQIVGKRHVVVLSFEQLVVKIRALKVNQITCIAPRMVQTTLKRSGIDHTAFNLQRTPCLPLPRKRSPDGASTECGGRQLIAAHYSFIDPERMKG